MFIGMWYENVRTDMSYIADRAEVSELVDLVLYKPLIHHKHVQPLNGGMGTWEWVYVISRHALCCECVGSPW